jgi:ABC-type antimicrobial peptide transport system permease subunit
MTWHDLARTSVGNLRRHPVRTVLSAVGVTVGILTLVTMMSLGVGVRQEFLQTLDGVGLETVQIRPVTEDRSAFTAFAEPKRKVLITQALVDEMRARDDVVQARPRIYTPASMNVSLKVGDQMLRVRLGEYTYGFSDPFTTQPEIVAGEALGDDAQGEIVVSASALAALGYKELEDAVGQEATLVLNAPRGDEQTFPLHIAGVLDTSYGADAGYFGSYVAVSDALAMKAWWYNDPDILEREGYDVLTVKAASLKDAVQIAELFEERGFRIQSLRAILDMMNRAMVVVQIMLASVGGLALFVASLGIANTMVMAVYERTREIGILKAVGASPGDIRALFVVEAALIGLLGGIVGTICGWLLGIALNQGILAVLRWQEIPIEGRFFVTTPWLVLLALAFATVVGLLAGLYPAARAARLDPLDALRYE